MATRLALHTWTLLSTPLADAVRIARDVGWEGVELSGRSFAPGGPTALPAAEVERVARAGGLPVACLSVDLGWMWAEGDARTSLLRTFDERCRMAAALGAPLVMSPVD